MRTSNPPWADRSAIVAIRFVLMPLIVCAAVIYAIKGYAVAAVFCLVIFAALLGARRMFESSLRSSPADPAP